MALDFEIEAKASLARHFGLSSFRPGQAEVIESVLAKRNVLVVMPTGAGKSLCYQLPATLLPGLTLVVSPLIALMKDQVEQLSAKGISATAINSMLTEGERAQRVREIREGRYKLVYAAPERLRSASFLETIGQVGVDLFAIDEAHCISQWGHDFRPDYALLGQARKKLLPPRTLALTATATPEVQGDIVRSLLMKDPKVFVAGFDRPNLFLEVHPFRNDDDRRSAIESLVEQGGSGLVYCATRKTAESLHRSLSKSRPGCVLYHAGMDDDDRRRAQDTFMAANEAIAVATNAFGMGIDKPDIRFVVHANIPRAVEAYYQEIGRAGRDGQPATAVLLFNHTDVFTQERMISSNHPSRAVFSDLWDVLRQASELRASQAQLAAQIGASEQEVSAALRLLEREGKLSRQRGGEADLSVRLTDKAKACAPHAKSAKAVLDALRSSSMAPVPTSLAELASRSGLSLEDARHGLKLLEKSQAIQVRHPSAGRVLKALSRVPFSELGLDLGRMREQEKRSLLLLRRMTDYAYSRRCRRRFLLEYFGDRASSSRCDGCDVCSGPRVRTSAKRKAPATALQSVPSGYNELAATELRRWRRELSLDLGIPPFIIFNDATLFALAQRLPVDRRSFLSVKGTGAARWERFGPKVVEICLMARASGHSDG